jgi:hypothetical protein
MSAMHTFQLARAAEARIGAAAATLDHVRDRWLRSEASWTALAARSGRNDEMRAMLVANKAAERARLEDGEPDTVRLLRLT